MADDPGQDRADNAEQAGNARPRSLAAPGEPGGGKDSGSPPQRDRFSANVTSPSRSTRRLCAGFPARAVGHFDRKIHLIVDRDPATARKPSGLWIINHEAKIELHFLPLYRRILTGRGTGTNSPPRSAALPPFVKSFLSVRLTEVSLARHTCGVTHQSHNLNITYTNKCIDK